jgi:hypothetical protein
VREREKERDREREKRGRERERKKGRKQGGRETEVSNVKELYLYDTVFLVPSPGNE